MSAAISVAALPVKTNDPAAGATFDCFASSAALPVKAKLAALTERVSVSCSVAARPVSVKAPKPAFSFPSRVSATACPVNVNAPAVTVRSRSRGTNMVSVASFPVKAKLPGLAVSSGASVITTYAAIASCVVPSSVKPKVALPVPTSSP